MAVLQALATDQDFQKAIDRTDEVGAGTNRRVFGVLGENDFIIKESTRPFHYSNFVEWII